MAGDWRKLNGEVGLAEEDEPLPVVSSSPAGEEASTTCPSRRSITRQKSRESPRKEEPPGLAVRRSLVGGRKHNDELVSILASEESLVPVSRTGYENNLALLPGEREDEEEADECRHILEQSSAPAGREETGASIRGEARRELLREAELRPASIYHETEKLANGKGRLGNDGKDRLPPPQQQHHVQFNRNLLNATEAKQGKSNTKQQHQGGPSPSISSSSSSSSSGESSLERLTEARPPDGGWGWVVVAAAFMVNLIADGITFSFGVIYHEFLKYFGEGKATTSWIGSLFMAMPLLSGPIASFLTDRYGCRRVTIAGSILATTGFIVSYFATSLEMLTFTFGVLAGFGLSLCFVAAVVIVAYYFEKRRSFATGLSVCGSGIGTFIFPPLIQRLLEEYGWRGTTLILSGLFLNLAVCGGLMRDLEWTRPKSQEARRRRERERKLRLRMQSSSADSFSASSSANTAQTLHGPAPPDHSKRLGLEGAALVEQGLLRPHPEHEAAALPNVKLFSSLVSLPTFVKNGEKVPLEVLELLSAKKNVYNVLIQNYPSLLISSRSFSDSSGLNDQLSPTSPRLAAAISPPLPIEGAPKFEHTEATNRQEEQAGFHSQHQQENNCLQAPGTTDWWVQSKASPDAQLRRSSASEHPRRLPTAYLKDIRVHRRSLTYRGAMLNINRYRLRASSCPDILRNSMTTIAKEEAGHSGLREFRELIVNIFDLTHFREPMFTLFSISNFLLHAWYDVPYMYLTDNAVEMGFHESEASYLISVIGIMNMAGEILLGWAGDRACVNASVVYAVCMALTGAFAALIPAVIRCYYMLCAIAGAFGFFIAANYSLTSIILVKAITIERFTNAYGLLLFVQGIANLMGPPIAGWLYDVTGSYDLSFYLAGGFIAASGLMLLVMPLVRCYRGLGSKSTRKQAAPATRDFAGINSV